MNGTRTGTLCLFQHNDLFSRLRNAAGGDHAGAARADDQGIAVVSGGVMRFHGLGWILRIINGTHRALLYTFAAGNTLFLIDPGLLTIIVRRTDRACTVAVGAGAAVLIHN